MNWAYIAGFLDGDGCISKYAKTGRYSASFCQSTKNIWLLKRIQRFLSANNIKSNLSTYKTKSSFGGWLSTLAIGNADSLDILLKSMLPHLVLKKQKARDAIQYLRNRNRKRSKYSIKMEKAISDYILGKSSLYIQKKYGIWHTTLGIHLRKRGLAMRTHRDANRLAYASRSRQIRARIREGMQKANTKKREERILRLKPSEQMYKSGMTLKAIGTEMGVSYVTIRHHLIDVGIQLRSPSQQGTIAWVARKHNTTP